MDIISWNKEILPPLCRLSCMLAVLNVSIVIELKVKLHKKLFLIILLSLILKDTGLAAVLKWMNT
jgi:hypothetical protein